MLGRLPSLRTLDQLIYHATVLGLPFLTMGMAAGVIRAETFKVAGVVDRPDGAAVGRSPGRSTLALVAGRVARRLVRAAPSSWLAVAGLVLLLVIRFAAVPYLSGFHTYGG